MSTQLYINNIDWPANNIRLYRDVSKEDSKWHFMMYDTDDSMNMLTYKCGPEHDPFIKATHWKSGPLEEDCLLGLMLSKLIVNPEFKNLFRNTFLRIGEETFAPDKVRNYLSMKKYLLAKPMVKNYQRFVNDSYKEDYFLDCVDLIQSFFDNRYNYAVQYLNEHIA